MFSNTNLYINHMEQFYKLTIKNAIADRKAGKLTTYGLIDYYIRIKIGTEANKKLILSPHDVCQEIDISISQFYRAITKIKAHSDISANVNYTHINYRFNKFN